MVESCDESISIAEDLLALAERWEQELRSYRAHSATRRLPRFLIGHPVLSVQQAAADLSISVPAANAALNDGESKILLYVWVNDEAASLPGSTDMTDEQSFTEQCTAALKSWGNIAA